MAKIAASKKQRKSTVFGHIFVHIFVRLVCGGWGSKTIPHKFWGERGYFNDLTT